MIAQLEKKLRLMTEVPIELRALLLSSFLVALGSFMVTPFLGIYLKDTLQMDVEFVGALLAFATFVQFAGGYFGGLIAGNHGLKATMTKALWFRTFGFTLLALATAFHLLVIPAVVLVAAGSAVYMPANKAYVISSSASGSRPFIMSLSNTAFNAGMALGPLVAVSFIKRPSELFLGIGVSFIFIALLHQKSLSNLPVGPKTKLDVRGLLEQLVQVKRPFLFSSLTFYFYFFFQNFMGLYVSEKIGMEFFGKVMLINFATMFSLQLLFSKRISTVAYKNVLMVSFGFIALGSFLISRGDKIMIIFGTVTMISGQAALLLRGDLELVAELPDKPAMAFGIQRLSAGAGGLLSGVVGGFIFDEFFWQKVSVQCMFAIALSFFFGRSVSKPIS